MKFERIRKVPVVELDGKKCVIDTGYPYAVGSLDSRVQQFFGIPGLHVAGVQSLRRYTKFDYSNCEITTSDEPIPLECGETVPLEVRNLRWLVKMTVGGVEGKYYIDSGAAFSYVHNLSTDFPSAGIADECSFDGRPWTAPMRRVPCEFAGHPFEILCGDASDNKARLDCCAVPPRRRNWLRLLQQLHRRHRPPRRQDDIRKKLKGDSNAPNVER
ncbi:MAG: hypothetical protein IJH50_06745 [Kiritimatiellae bacterium]|nr:hypothetical protein [Kiritimatiellia bacterium]